ncbi:MAG TPA: glutamine amidotransferase [Syntrophomonadaceae bacterium]|nr:glutamine amidotransferase [Syntrophomonadaceae bacterium]HNX29142.1 glutamine amidotransferase [Syntrophomonadaceae bacterium]HPR93685.1 glutamine amidotransferase [Syntrophomonadaceae bacterium]
MEKIIIAHMYPDLMDLYGDRGNLICLKKRLNDYGCHCEIRPVYLKEKIDFKKVDMLFMGGGSDREQGLVYNDLLIKAERLKEEIEHGLPALCICGAYQLLGKYYKSFDGSIMKGLGFFDLYTEGQKNRLIGNILIESAISGEKYSVVGFENHGGRTWLNDNDLHPFGTVIKGFGNNGKDGSEGLWYKNLIGTYLHGPLLPKNPHIADYFIKTIAARKGLTLEKQLNDDIEWFAHQQVIKKMKV